MQKMQADRVACVGVRAVLFWAILGHSWLFGAGPLFEHRVCMGGLALPFWAILGYSRPCLAILAGPRVEHRVCMNGLALPF